jgi:NAD(P)-dependent dehydrogenase (short-subunit alcohol dehydrogenase family)
MNRLAERVIVVTGAGRGIGAGIAELCAREGARVVVNDVGAEVDGTGQNAAPASEVVSRIVAGGGTAIAHFADVSDTEQATDLIDTAIREFGRLDVLVNVAGIVRDRMIFNMLPAEWDAVINVHLRGTFNTSRAAARYWRERQEGHYRLINTTSGAGLYGAPGQPNYSAAKLGIVGFTYSCANALMRYGVTANALSPSAMTRMVDTIPDMSRIGATTANGSRSQMTAENVAPSVAYVASVHSDWFTGQVFGARGLSVSLYSRPHVTREITTTGGHAVDDIFDSFERVFRPAVEGAENHYENVARQDLAARQARESAQLA